MRDAAILLGGFTAALGYISWESKRARAKTARRVFTGRNRP